MYYICDKFYPNSWSVYRRYSYSFCGYFCLSWLGYCYSDNSDAFCDSYGRVIFSQSSNCRKISQYTRSDNISDIVYRRTFYGNIMIFYRSTSLSPPNRIIKFNRTIDSGARDKKILSKRVLTIILSRYNMRDLIFNLLFLC